MLHDYTPANSNVEPDCYLITVLDLVHPASCMHRATDYCTAKLNACVGLELQMHEEKPTSACITKPSSSNRL